MTVDVLRVTSVLIETDSVVVAWIDVQNLKKRGVNWILIVLVTLLTRGDAQRSCFRWV